MMLEREVIVDLLPAYFSGEASAATRALVEEYFREHPEFAQSALSAGRSLESLRIPPTSADSEREKLAFERARMVNETRSSFLWLAVMNTLLLFLFRIQNGKVVFVLWHPSIARGMLFAAIAAFFWLLFFYVRRRTEPLPSHVKFLWMAVFYTVLLFLFKVENHRLVWVFFSGDSPAGFIFAFFALGLWVIFFYQRWQRNRKD